MYIELKKKLKKNCYDWGNHLVEINYVSISFLFIFYYYYQLLFFIVNNYLSQVASPFWFQTPFSLNAWLTNFLILVIIWVLFFPCKLKGWVLKMLLICFIYVYLNPNLWLQFYQSKLVTSLYFGLVSIHPFLFYVSSIYLVNLVFYLFNVFRQAWCNYFISVNSVLLLLTLSIISGGYWSYNQTTWGFWWTWDPVELVLLLLLLIGGWCVHFRVNYYNLFSLICVVLGCFSILYLIRKGFLVSRHSFFTSSTERPFGILILFVLATTLLLANNFLVSVYYFSLLCVGFLKTLYVIYYSFIFWILRIHQTSFTFLHYLLFIFFITFYNYMYPVYYTFFWSYSFPEYSSYFNCQLATDLILSPSTKLNVSEIAGSRRVETPLFYNFADDFLRSNQANLAYCIVPDFSSLISKVIIGQTSSTFDYSATFKLQNIDNSFFLLNSLFILDTYTPLLYSFFLVVCFS